MAMLTAIPSRSSLQPAKQLPIFLVYPAPVIISKCETSEHLDDRGHSQLMRCSVCRKFTSSRMHLLLFGFFLVPFGIVLVL